METYREVVCMAILWFCVDW